MKKRRVLIIHHRSQYGGAPRSLIENLNYFKKDRNLKIDIICPKGEVFYKIEKLGFNIIPTKGVPIFDNSNFGYYKKLRWLILIREIYFLIYFLFTFRNIKENYDIIHLNEILCFPIIPYLKKKFSCKIITHQRTKLSTKNSLRIKWMNSILKKNVFKIICIDKDCQLSLHSSLRNKSVIILNCISKKNEKKNRSINRFKKDLITFGFVGQLNESKGIKKLIKAFKLLSENKNIELKIYSPFPIFNLKNLILNYLNIRKDFYLFYKRENLVKYKNIKFMGYIKSLEKVYKNIDVLVFPNEDYAIGRPVFEAGYYGIPSLVAHKHKKSEYLINGKTGYIINPNTPENLLKNIKKINNKKTINKFGAQALKLSKQNFSVSKNSKKIVNLYFS